MYQDILKDTEIYQIIVQEGVEKGLSQGREAFHQVILEDVQERFPDLLTQATESINAVTDLSILKKLVRDMISAHSLDEAQTLLQTLKKNQGH